MRSEHVVVQAADAEKQDALGAFVNENVRCFEWSGVTATHDKGVVVDEAYGEVRAGELLAIMGPSGCGKTTLLQSLAKRTATSSLRMSGSILVNNEEASQPLLRQLSSMVEQEDYLIGSLTVRETLDFAARLSLPSSISKAQRRGRVDALLAAFGLTKQKDMLVGTPIRKGISGGQKRRLSIASQLITSPKILFLDEPTSGLDSTASFEVISYLRNVAKATDTMVIASIHQPSTAVFETFDRLMLMSEGRTAYFGSRSGLREHMAQLGFVLPLYANPAESLLDLLNTDFGSANDSRLSRVIDAAQRKPGSKSEETLPPVSCHRDIGLGLINRSRRKRLSLPLTLVHRSFIKSYRDIVAYGIRVAMYMGLAVLMGTVWLRLEPNQESIQAFINAIFFGGAFMSFMAVAYIPAYLEDRSTFIKERADGLYGPTSFLVANFLIGLPYLFIICILFSIIAYWLTGFRVSGEAFFTWIMWLYLDLLAAESLVVLISSIMPIFVVALAATAFANGLWMSVGGFLVPVGVLNVFWRYVFHYIDYQAYVFQGMMVNEFGNRTYSCGQDCHCMYDSPLASQCKIPGTAVLKSYGYSKGHTGEWVAILLAIIVVYRMLAWVALYVRKS